MATGIDRPIVDNAPKSFTIADLSSLPTDLPSGTVDYELEPLTDIQGNNNEMPDKSILL